MATYHSVIEIHVNGARKSELTVPPGLPGPAIQEEAINVCIINGWIANAGEIFNVRRAGNKLYISADVSKK